MRAFWKLCVAVFAAAISPAAYAGPWMRADTHNFILYGNGSEAQLRDYATKLEKFDAALRYLLTLPKEPQPNRLEIYMVADGEDVSRLKRDDSTVGFYEPSLDGTYAIANRHRKGSKFDLDGLTVLFHEYAHHMMYRYFNYSYPSWFSEGFAEYVSTIQFDDDGTWTKGYPAFHRNFDLVGYESNYSVEKMIYNELNGRAKSTFGLYAFGWLTVHMLFSTPDYQKKLNAYLTAFGQGTPARQAATSAFGDMKAFAASVIKYRDGKLIYNRSDMPLDYDKTIAVRTLGEDEGKLVLLAMEQKAGTDPQRTRDRLVALYARFPGNAAIAYELALAERDLAVATFTEEARSKPDDKNGDQGTIAQAGSSEPASSAPRMDASRYARAFAALDNVLAIDPKHLAALDLKGRLMIETLAPENAEGWKVARRAIIAANRVAPDQPAPLFDYYMSYKYQGVELPAAAKAALAQAYGTIPEVPDVTIQYAFSQAEEGKFRAAEMILKAEAFNPHSGGSLGPLRTLADMERLKTGSTPIDAELAAWTAEQTGKTSSSAR